MTRRILVITAALFLTLAAAAQPRMTNAKLQTRQVAAGTLAKEMEAFKKSGQQPLWVGYSVSADTEERFLCCWGDTADFARKLGCCSGCRLEGRNTMQGSTDNPECGPLEPANEVNILYRIAEGRVQRIQVYTPNCALDAGGLSLVWLEGVQDRESIAYLRVLANQYAAEADFDKKAANHAVMAIAMHDHPDSDAALAEFIGPPRPPKMREHAAFWLGQRGKRGFAPLQRAIREEQDPSMRARFVFPLSQNSEPAALDELLRLAKQDTSTKVRRDAIFWLAQKAGQKAAAAISDAIENDPETEVKKHAVFALTQMPKEEGVPRLIQLARSHKNRAVRKAAIFWLGQTDDPKAVAFLEEVLLKK
jgi:hypothetical protein